MVHVDEISEARDLTKAKPSKKPRSEKRRREEQIKIRVSAEEYGRIQVNAAAAQLPVADFLRRIGQGYEAESRIDQMAIRELCLAAGDLGRLGGLLKLWMGERRSGSAPMDSIDQRSIEELWKDIQIMTGAIKERVKSL